MHVVSEHRSPDEAYGSTRHTTTVRKHNPAVRQTVGGSRLRLNRNSVLRNNGYKELQQDTRDAYPGANLEHADPAYVCFFGELMGFTINLPVTL